MANVRSAKVLLATSGLAIRLINGKGFIKKESTRGHIRLERKINPSSVYQEKKGLSASTAR